MRLIIMAVALLPCLASAEIYKCVGADGRVNLTDKPCDGAAASPNAKITVDVAPSADAQRATESAAERAAKWEAMQRFGYVELPAAERKAAELMASSDPKARALGKEMAWQAHLGREKFEQLRKLHEGRKAIDDKYDASKRQLNGY